MVCKNLFSVISLALFAFIGNTAFAWCPPADLTGDCVVDYEDLAIIAANWLWRAPDPNQFSYIPAGEFEMGKHLPEGAADELPVHSVYIDSFYAGTFEVSNQRYCDFLNATDVKVVSGVVYASSDSGNSYPYLDTHSADIDSQISYDGDDFGVRSRDGYSMGNHPVVEVSWFGAASYCNWRSRQEGYQQCYDLSAWQCDFSKNGYRLPTEAEWEYAARGGCYYYKYPWCNNSIDCTTANYGNCNPVGLSSHPYTSPVGYYSANNLGLSDMAGNIWEWCNDWYDSDYYDVSAYDNPTGPESGSYRVLRGGSWNNSAEYCRVANRDRYGPSYRYDNYGFRIVLPD